MVVRKFFSYAAGVAAVLVVGVSVFATTAGGPQSLFSPELLTALFEAQPEVADADVVEIAEPEKPGATPVEVTTLAPAEVSETDGPAVANEEPVPSESTERLAVRYSYDVHLAVDGLLAGRINAIDPSKGQVVSMSNVQVTLSRYDGTVIQAETGEGGVFQAAGVQPGVYSLNASGAGGFLAYAINVLPPQTGVGEENERTANGALWLDTMLASPENGQIAQELMGQNGPSETVASGGRGIPAAAAPIVATPLVGHVANLTSDGRLIGRFRRIEGTTGAPLLANRTRVYFVRDGDVISDTSVDSRGVFNATGVTPGRCTVVAVGQDGFASFGVTVTAGTTLTPEPEEETTRHKLTAYRNETTTEAPSAVTEALQIDAALIDWGFLPNEEQERLEELFGCGCGCGCDGGGGGAGGGSGLLGLLGLAGLAGLDDGDESPASPAGP